MTLGRVHRFALLLTVTVALLGMLKGAPVVAISGALTIIVIWARVRRLRDTSRPLALVILVHGLTVAGLGGAAIVFTESRVDAVLVIVMLGVANRFVLRGGHRDDLILVGASLVLFTVNTTISPGLEFLALFVLYLPLSFWALWASTLIAAAPERATRPVPAGMRAIAIGGFALTFAGFVSVVLLPRYRFGKLLSAGYLMQLAGSSTTMELTTGGVRPPSGGTPVMQVEPRDGVGSGIVHGLYARLFTLDTFDGRAFHQSERGRAIAVYPKPRHYTGDYRQLLPEDSAGTVLVTMERLERRGSKHPIATLGRAGPSYVAMTGLHQGQNGVWFSPASRAFANIIYKVDLDLPAPIAQWPIEQNAAVVERLLQLPDRIDPRVVDLAKRLASGETTTRGKAAKILAHFDRGFAYSLDPLDGDSDDPLVRFLFEAKAGHCELYAAAVAVLLRIVGVQARVATGYYGGWWNETAGYLELSSTDAHAWVEIYDEAYGWRWIDATPAAERDRGKDRSWAWLVGFYRAAEKLWYDRVVDFDEAKRKRLIADVRDQVARLEVPLFDRNVGRGEPGSSGRGAAVAIIGFVAVMVIATVVGRRRQRNAAVLGLRLRKALGAHTGQNATLGELLATVRDHRAAAKEAVQLYEAWRFGGTADPAGSGSVLAAIRRLERGA